MELASAQELLCQLIRVPSVTATQAELDAVRLLAQKLCEMGFEPQLIESAPNRVNLVVKLCAKNPTQPPLVLISHLDVVEVSGLDWSFPPFSGEVLDGRIQGRGTLDTKQLTVMQVYAMAQLLQDKEKLNRDCILIAVVDEEKGSTHGMQYLSQNHKELFAPNSLVISEGGGFPVLVNSKAYMTVTAGEKGLARVRIKAVGQGGHPGVIPNEQAIVRLCDAISSALNDMNSFSPTPATMAERMLATMQVEKLEQIDDTTAQDLTNYCTANSVGMRDYTLGQRSNIIPASAEIVLECKTLPQVTRQQLEQFFKDCLGKLPVEWEITCFEQGFESTPQQLGEMLGIIETHCHEHGFEGAVLPMLALGRTDGRFFGFSGAVVYGFSPLLLEDNFGAVLQKVHRADESVGVQSFSFGCKVMRSLCVSIAVR